MIAEMEFEFLSIKEWRREVILYIKRELDGERLKENWEVEKY